jgi:large repetitive protein
VTDDSGCTAEATDNFLYVPICIPDVLTPDGNGENDDWGPGCVDPSVYPNLVTRIYDRYGRLLATLPIGARWAGQYDGKNLPSGDYWYVIKVDNSDGQEIVGHFTLYR